MKLQNEMKLGEACPWCLMDWGVKIINISSYASHIVTSDRSCSPAMGELSALEGRLKPGESGHRKKDASFCQFICRYMHVCFVSTWISQKCWSEKGWGMMEFNQNYQYVLPTRPVTGRFQRAAKASALHWPRRRGARVLLGGFGVFRPPWKELTQASSASSSPKYIINKKHICLIKYP